MKIYLHQFTPDLEPGINYQALVEIFEKNSNADLIVCPELFLTGFAYDKLEELATENLYHIKNIQKLCANSKTAFAGTFFWKEGKRYFNRALFIDDQGDILTFYDKRNLIPAFKENEYLTAGKKKSIIKYKEVYTGIAICYDLRFPELFREYGKKETDLVIVMAQWPESRMEHLKILASARALENQCYLVVVNTVGMVGKIEMAGHSMIVSPRGEILLDLQKSNRGKLFQIHLAEVLKFRSEFPVLYQYSRPGIFNKKFFNL